MSLTAVPRSDWVQASPDAEDTNGAPAPRDAEAPTRPRRPRRRRALVVAIGTLVVALVGAGVMSDLRVRSELGQARSSLRATRASLAATVAHLSNVEAKLVSTTNDRDTLGIELKLTAWELAGAESTLASTRASLADTQSNLASTQNSLATTQNSLSNANTGLYLQGLDIGKLNTCLGGVETALNQIAVNNQSGAVHSLSAVASSCQAVQGQGLGGPVYPFDFPDPDVVRVGASYFGYATNSATGNIQMIESSDLAHWSVLGDALPHLGSWARPHATWAPGVMALNGGFVMYYTALDNASGAHCISVATASSPQGPFTDNTTAPVMCQSDLGGSIDPSPFTDASGTPYLLWKSEGAKRAPTRIRSERLSADGLSMAGAPAVLLQPNQSWESGNVEGPSMLVSAGHYELFYSANDWNTAKYAIGAVTCQGPAGPCSGSAPHPLLGSQSLFTGPGGPSVFSDSGGTLWIAFHAWLPGAVGYPHSRLLFLRSMTFDGRTVAVQNP